VSGVCGNYNLEAGDDLRTASGLVLDSATAFGDSWKLHSYCPAVGLQQVIFYVPEHFFMYRSISLCTLQFPLDL
jgi:hypothetical protein